MAATSLVAKLFAGKACVVSLGHGFGGSLLPRSGGLFPRAALIAPRKHFLTSAALPRVYGPEPLNERKDEVHHWTNERYVAMALIPIIPTALAFPNIVLDTTLCAAMLLHTHWRLSGVVQDYIHGAAYHFFKYLVLALSITSFGSLCYFNYADVGFARAVRLIYTQL